MDIIIWILVFIIGVWTIIPLLDKYIDLESRGVEVAPGFLIWRTKYGLSLLDRVVDSSKRLWKIFGVTGAIIGSILMLFTFLSLTDKAVDIISSILAPPPAEAGGVSGVIPLIPGWTIPIGLIIPFLIGLATVLIVHEPAHGITARRIGLPVKSTGLLFFAVLPGAFVEPDEDKLKKAPVSDRLQVYGAGSFANILFGFLCFGLMLILITPLPGLYLAGVYENTPASDNLQPGMRLMEIGYVENTTFQVGSYQDFKTFMNNTHPGDNIQVVTDDGTFILTLTSYPKAGENLTLLMEEDNQTVTVENKDNNGFLGVCTPYYPVSKLKIGRDIFASLFLFWESPDFKGGGINQYSYDYRVPGLMMEVLQMIFLLNVGIGLFNLLPLKPLDGGHIAECLTEKASSKKTARRIALILSVVTLAIVIINLSVLIT